MTRFTRWAALTAALALCTAAAAQGGKQELVAKVLQLQQPGIETMARALIEQPAVQLMQQVANVIRQRVPADKREALARDIQGEVRKFVDDTVPTVRSAALRLAPSTIGAVLEEKLTEDELRELIRVLESPTYRKYQGLAGEMQRSIAEKLVAETRGTVTERMRALEKLVQQRMAPYVPKPATAPKTN